MTNYPSRYLRPEHPRPMKMTPRDLAVLRAIAKHRYLTCEHVQMLFFSGRAARVAQRRLRLLFENGYIDRYFCPVVLTGTRMSAKQSPRPLYTLGRAGARALRENSEPGTLALPSTPSANARGYATLAHHLVATDLLVALEAACAGREDVELERTEREDELRRKVAAARQQQSLPSFLVSDGAFTLRYPRLGRSFTYHLEVVRALSRSGNRTLEERMVKYARLHHEGYFAAVFGHTLRAVLIATTSERRAEHYRQLAARLQHGRNLFWFTCYGKEMRGGVPATHFRRDAVLRPIWRTVDDRRVSLLAP